MRTGVISENLMYGASDEFRLNIEKKNTQNMRNNLFRLLSRRADVQYAPCTKHDAWKKIAR